jgi:hypothetical protein
MLVLFQLLAHVLIWWNLVGLRNVASINFLQYLFVALGPTVLDLGTTLLVPDVKEATRNLRTEYWRLRKPYYSILILFWAWNA